MEKDLTLTYCRYYKGEKEPPTKFNDVESTIWSIERMWVEKNGSKDDTLSLFVEDYLRFGLVDFHNTDGIPIALKATLLNRYNQYGERIDIDGFKKFYEKYYTKKEGD